MYKRRKMHILKKALAVFMIVFVISNCFSTPVLADEKSYEPDAWAKYEIGIAEKLQLLPKSVWKADFTVSITRREFAEIIVRTYETATGTRLKTPKEKPFKDTSYAYALKAADVGLMSGFKDSTFRLKEKITRQEIALMIYNALYAKDIGPSSPSNISLYFEDKDSVADWAILPIYTLYRNNIMNTSENDEIQPLREVTRQEAMVMTVRALYHTVSEVFNKAGIYLTGSPHIYGDNSDSEKLIAYKGNAHFSCFLSRPYDKDGDLLFQFSSLDGVSLLEMAATPSYEGSSTFNLDMRAFTGDWDFDTGAWTWNAIKDNLFDKLFSVKSTDSDESKTIILKIIPRSAKGLLSGNVLETRIQLWPYLNRNDHMFGNPNGSSFESDAKAKSYMETVKINVWKLNNNGTKYASTAYLTIHKMLAADVKSIFQEIFDSGEQFPIKDIGGYNWRNGSHSEHAIGTAIDINANENAFIAPDGSLKAGSFYKPGENPYSMPNDSIIVQTFLKYGWGWGGNGWSNGNDYMHFSYFGS